MEAVGKEPPEVSSVGGLTAKGNSLAMARDMRGFLLAQYRELGPVFSIR